MSSKLPKYQLPKEGIENIIASQLRAARLAGLCLIAMGTGLFAEFYVRFPSSLIVNGDAVKTARNIIANELLFRLGIANNIITFAIDVVLIWALYVLLKSGNRNLALLAVFFRLVETTIAYSLSQSPSLSIPKSLRLFLPSHF